MYWSQDISKDKTLDAQMMAMTVINGVVDVATYTTYRVFATKQTGKSTPCSVVPHVKRSSLLRIARSANRGPQLTLSGNTLFLAIHALHPGKLGYEVELNIAVSILVFIIGSIIFGQLGNKIRQGRRGWIFSTTGFQTLLLVAATAVRAFAPRNDIGGPALAVIALLALAASAQVSLASGLGLAELNTTVITIALVSDLLQTFKSLL